MIATAASPEATRPRWRVVVADDESLARVRLRHLLDSDSRFEIVDESRNGSAAVDAILKTRPDVVFLDVAMPGLNGLEVAEAVAEENPIVVFVTAYDEHALRAFEVCALDYLLKPVDRERFRRTLARVDSLLAHGSRVSQDSGVRRILERAAVSTPYRSRFLVRSTRGHYFVRADDIEWAAADGNYVALHASGRVHLVRYTMKLFESQLNPARFKRVHRSAIVNIDCVRRFESRGHGEYLLQLASGARVLTSRAYAAHLNEWLRR
jgi:two-component system LytT family response regulator